MNKIKKKLCVMVLLTVIFGLDVSAATLEKEETVVTQEGEADFKRGDSEIIIRGKGGQSLIGKEFLVYRLFDVENAKGGESVQYTFHQKYADALKRVVGDKLSKPMDSVTEYMVVDYIQALNSKQAEGRYSEYRYFVEELRDEMKKRSMKGDTVQVASVKSDNSIKIKGLVYGYYIIDEVTAIDGEHSASSLCMVDTANPSAAINIKSDYPTVEKKIREDDNRESIGNEGWNDIGDFEIGQIIPYRFGSNIPDMNGYKTYYFAWHDKMDPALTFREDSVAITITDEKLQKEYQLTKEEFQIIQKKGNEETFLVEITDLKKIVDREFDRMNNLKENSYGQEIILRYDAVLNELAVKDTGRPGFENDVKLEFSNNPDSDGAGSTGETAWDTVVCFTYKLNGLKINNHDKPLSNAKFRLYSDEACKEEVYVKKIEDGYHVINRDSLEDSGGGTLSSETAGIISDAQGVFTILGLDGGTYWLKELEAPPGYRPILDPIKVEVTPTYTTDRNAYVKGSGDNDKTLIKLEFKAYIKQFLSGVLGDETLMLESSPLEGSGNLTVVNQVGAKMPATGSHRMILMVATGIIFMICGLWRRRIRTKESDA